MGDHRIVRLCGQPESELLADRLNFLESRLALSLSRVAALEKENKELFSTVSLLTTALQEEFTP